MFKWASSAVIVAVMGLVPVALTSSPSWGLSANCSVGRQTIEEWGADKHRVKVKCTKVGSSTLVRGKLPITAGPDSVSPWFHKKNAMHYGQYKKAYNWQLGSPIVEMKG